MKRLRFPLRSVVCAASVLSASHGAMAQEARSPIYTKVFHLPPAGAAPGFDGEGLRVGDCLMFREGHQRAPATVTIYSDGRIHFDAVIRSEDSGDKFNMQFWAVDAQGNFLFRYYPAPSPEMPRSRDMEWHLRDGTFHPGQFKDIHRLFWSSPGCHG